MRITIAGANGFIGTYLSTYLKNQGHDLTLLVRKPYDSPHRLLLWNPYVGEIDASAIDGQDVVINLAGKNVAAERWSERVKREIIKSRTLATELIGHTFAKAARPPGIFLNASAIGIYGHRRPEEVVTEESPPGTGFLAQSCITCERSSQKIEELGVRVLKMRIGIVLAEKGGALKRMLPFFKLGLGGKLGSGDQIMSWIALPEIGPIVQHIMATREISGPVNVTTPQPVSNSEFTRTLGRALHRPALFSVPAFALYLAFGQMAGEALLGGAHIIPQKLIDTGYSFRHPELSEVLATTVAKK